MSVQAADRIASALARWGIDHEILRCDPAAADTVAFCSQYGYSLDDSANTILVVGKADPPVFVACVALASTRLDVNGVVRRRLDVPKASFASAEDTASCTGMMIGGVTAVGLPDDIPVWVDVAVMERPYVVLGGGNRSQKLWLRPTELRKIPTVEVVDGLARPAAD